MNKFRTLLLSSTLPLALGSAAAQVDNAATASSDVTVMVSATKVSLDESKLGKRARRMRAIDLADQVRLMSDELANAPMAGELVMTTERKTRFGRTHQRFEQKVGGRRIYGADVNASFAGDGRMVRLNERVTRGGKLRVRPARLTAQEALGVAVAHHFPGAPVPSVVTSEGIEHSFAEAAFYHDAPRVEEVLIPTKRGFAVAHVAKIWSAETNDLFHTLIGPRGQVMDVQDRTARDQYGAWADHPGNSTQVIFQGPGAGNAQSPNGWLFSGAQSRFNIRGNNVSAYLDTNADNRPDGGGATITDGSFIRAFAPADDPTTTGNREVAVQTLFYLNNVIHDTLYGYGFTETASNFQEDNFGRGGRGSDSVNAEAQDGSGVNNANFATPGDGANPRMQMFIWDRVNPRRDSDLDSDIVWHEYGHGLTWRMIGNMSGPVSGAIGEGMGDVLAIVANDDDAVGEYAANRANGIRSERYGVYSRTLGDFVGNSVHRDGEIYAATIWAMKGLYNAAGLSDDAMMRTVVEGMNFTAPGPDMIDMRNGILDAAPNGQDCLVWEAFARFGMGEGARQTANGQISLRESFDEPAACSGGGGGGATFPEAGAVYSLTNVASGNVLDSDANGAIDQYTSANRDDKFWTFEQVGTDTYKIVSARAGQGSLDSQPNNVIQWVADSSSNRDDKVFQLVRLSDGSVRFDNLWPNRGFLASNGSSAVIWNTGQQNDAARWVPAKVN